MNEGLADALFFEAGSVVPVASVLPDEAVMLDEEGEDLVVGEDFWWPSDVVQEVWVPAEAGLTKPLAALVTAKARARVMGWIGGAGLHPVEIYGRFANGCFLHGCGDFLVPPAVGKLLAHNPDYRWRGLMDAIFGKRSAKDRRALENEIYGVLLSASVDGRFTRGGVDGEVFRQAWFEMLAEDDDFPGAVVFRELIDWAAGALLEFLAAGGIEPFRVVQRFYGLCFYRYKSIIGEMNGRDLAGIMSQGRAQFSAMEKRIFTDPVEWITGERAKVKGQKSAEASAVYAANARKHKPKQMLDGQAGVSGLDVDLEAALASAEGQRRLADMKAAARAREVAAADAEWAELFSGKKGGGAEN